MLVGVDPTCNPSFMSLISGGSAGNATSDATPQSSASVSFDWKSIVSLAIFIACVLYSR